MIGYDDRDDPLAPARGIFNALIVMGCALLLGLVLFFSFSSRAHAQNQPTSCSGTAEVVAANISFRSPPTQYVMVVNPSASATLWLSTTTTAAANGSGSFPLVATGNSVTLPGMPTVSILASAGSTPYTCFYR